MANAPVFATVARIGFASVTVANTNRDGTGTIVDALTGVAAGTRIERVALQATANPADSTVQLYLHNGTSYLLYDEFDLGDPPASSATVIGYRTIRKYEDLVLPSASWKVAFAISAALTAGAINCFVLGADLT